MPSLTEWSGFAVAVGTGGLAVSTWYMARAAGRQADETGKLTTLAERQLAATGAPRLVFSSTTLRTLDRGTAVVVIVRNIGATAAEVESAQISTGEQVIDGTLAQTSVDPGASVVLEFAWPEAPGNHLETFLNVAVRYEGPGSGTRLALTGVIEWVSDHYRLVRHETRPF